MKKKASRKPARPRKIERFRLYAKPARGAAPPWWPRKAGRPQWVGVSEDGWTLAPGPSLTRAELREARAAAGDPEVGFIPGGRPPQFRTVLMGLS